MNKDANGEVHNKVTIIGAGIVGSTIAHSLIMRDTAEMIAMIDIDESLVAAQVMDLQHAVPFVASTQVVVGSYEDCRDSAVVVIACGGAQKPGQSRLELVTQNAAIMRKIIPQIFAQNPDVVIVMVTNPVDVLTQITVEMFPEKKNQIIGTGTILDSARLRHLLGQKLRINPRSIHAYMVGEHGDSEFPLWSTASIGNMSLGACKHLPKVDKDEITNQARNAAYAIIAGKQSTYYAIGAGAGELVRTIIYDKRTVLPVSHLLEGEYNIDGVCLSMPAVVGRGGIINKLCLQLTPDEQERLYASANTIKSVVASVSEVVYNKG